MPNDPKTYLHDIQQAARHIASFTEGKSYADYEQDRLLSSAVERQLQIIGEALSQLDREAPEMASRIPESSRSAMSWCTAMPVSTTGWSGV